MKVSKAQASDNRDAIVLAAAAQIRERGFDQMSVENVARAAGLTHGALYSHFKSKDALKAEATRRAFDDCIRAFSDLTPAEFLGRYLSPEHRDNPQEGCPTSALVSEVQRQSLPSQIAFRDGVAGFAALAADSLKSVGAKHDPDRALLMFAAMVGGLSISRAIREVDRAASDNILRAITEQIEELIAKPAKTGKRR
jgi:TetR/AcrR family transcriptional repressor of nem operon